MKFFSNDFIEQVRFSNDIVALIGLDTVLKQRGTNYLGLCPFSDHNEKTSSFSVSSDKQVYHCFGCKKSGNIFTYLQEQKAMDFQEAIIYLANKEGISIPKENAFHSDSAQSFQDLFDINYKASIFFHQQLLNLQKDSSILMYLKKRGYTLQIIKDFQIGYAPKGNLLLKSFKMQKQMMMAKSLGLLNTNDRGDFYDTYRHRLMFPIISQQRRVVGFGGRALDQSQQSKYINSKESKIFHKGKLLYGIHQSLKYIREQDRALIVEGYTDFLSLWKYGIKNGLATLGTALTSDHGNLLSRYVKSVILIFDGDEAGLKAAENSLNTLLPFDLEVKFVFLPNEEDPDSFLNKYGAKELNHLIQKSEDLFFYVLQKKLHEIKISGMNQIHLISYLLPFLDLLPNESNLKLLYEQRILDLFGRDRALAEKILREGLKKKYIKIQKGKINNEDVLSHIKKEEIEKFSLKQSLLAESLLLSLCLNKEEFFEKFMEEDVIHLIKTQEIVNIFKKLQNIYRKNPDKFDILLPSAMNYVSDKHLLLRESYLVFQQGDSSNLKIFEDCISFLEKEKKHLLANELIAQMKMNNTNDSKSLEKVLQLTKERLNSNLKKKKDINSKGEKKL